MHAPNVAKFLEGAILNALHRSSPFRVLYHYTDLAGAIGIIESQKFWSTAHDCTNDEAELISANPTVIEVAEECRQNARGSSRLVLDVFLANYPESMIVEVGNVYLTCFSKERDDANQWRDYGGNGSGVCVGLRVIEEAGPKFADRVSVMLEVDYSEASLRRWVREALGTSCAALDRARDIRHNHEEGLSAFYRIAAYASINTKHYKWKSEQEVRLATLARIGSRIVPLERISRNGKLIRYLSVPVRDENKLIAFDEIIIGANQNFDETREKFEALLATKRYVKDSGEYPKFTRSAISRATDRKNPRSPSFIDPVASIPTRTGRGRLE